MIRLSKDQVIKLVAAWNAQRTADMAAELEQVIDWIEAHDKPAVAAAGEIRK